MIEYLHNAIRATAGTNVVVIARLADGDGVPITSGAHFMLFEEDATTLLATIDGDYNSSDDIWEFILDAELTSGRCGKHWYRICIEGEPLCFKQPFYLCK